MIQNWGWKCNRVVSSFDGHCILIGALICYMWNHKPSSPLNRHLDYPREDLLFHTHLSFQIPHPYPCLNNLQNWYLSFQSVVFCFSEGSWGERRWRSHNQQDTASIVCGVLRYHWILTVFQHEVSRRKGLSALWSRRHCFSDERNCSCADRKEPV